ncbi:DUF3224 domain-containing protein [Streptomyces sp. NPDC016562]|uniref:DUF3224 domain-containing protein n=1 Tax=Streptomyces sp. NPDC016562 TaxID=3364966 RepID=UPI003702AB38
MPTPTQTPTALNTPASTSTPAPTPTPAETGGSFTFTDWQEQPVGPADVTPRLAHASVTNRFTGGIVAAATSCGYTLAYTEQSAGTYTGLELLSGSLDGREGTFVLEERGSFDADGTRCRFEVVPGSGTGELAGLTGSGGFTCRHGDTEVAYTFTYALGAGQA